ncbi:hypothetical protein [Georgenia alba]|uniref:DUF4190 domain-containing protein n=1 Tax=Georgenia alba TaxID=2233858 RepID=A0ABW2QE56_9MICO
MSQQPPTQPGQPPYGHQPGQPPQGPPPGQAPYGQQPGQAPQGPPPGQAPYGQQPGQPPYGHPGAYGAMPTGGSEEQNKLAVLSVVFTGAGVLVPLVVMFLDPAGGFRPWLMVLGAALGLSFARNARQAVAQGRANNGSLAMVAFVLAIVILVFGLLLFLFAVGQGLF